jgi:hypothetical protein
MARKWHSDEDILKLLREVDVRLASGSDVASACRAAGITDATYYTWRKNGIRLKPVTLPTHVPHP